MPLKPVHQPTWTLPVHVIDLSVPTQTGKNCRFVTNRPAIRR